MDAKAPFKSRSRCCEGCCQRRVAVGGADGQPTGVVESYRRRVWAQVHGPKFSVLLDLEPIHPGEDECAAALRLLGRLRRLYGPQFFDAVTADAWHTRAPFVCAVRRLGCGLVSVLKQERLTVHQEARVLAEGLRPVQLEGQERQVALREVRDLKLGEDGTEPVREVLSDEPRGPDPENLRPECFNPAKRPLALDRAARTRPLAPGGHLAHGPPTLGDREPCLQ